MLRDKKKYKNFVAAYLDRSMGIQEYSPDIREYLDRKFWFHLRIKYRSRVGDYSGR